MSGEACAWCHDVATEFVLDELGGQERAAVVRHLESCGACRREVASLAATMDTTISAVTPPVTPSEGFVERVVDTIIPPAPAQTEVSRPCTVSAASGRRRRPGRRMAAAAGMAAVLAGAVAAVVTISTGRGPSSALAAVAVAMRTQNGDPVGRATVTNQRPAIITVAFDAVGDGLSPDGRYQVIVVRSGGGTLQLGTVLVTSGRGGLQARASLPSTDIAAIEVVGSNGNDLCSGRLPGSPGPPGGPPPPP